MGEDENRVQDMSHGLSGPEQDVTLLVWWYVLGYFHVLRPQLSHLQHLWSVEFLRFSDLWKVPLCTLSLGCSLETKAPWNRGGLDVPVVIGEGGKKKEKTLSGHVTDCSSVYCREEDLSFDPQGRDGHREGNKLVCVSSFTHLISSLYSSRALMTETWNMPPTLSSRRMCEGSRLIKRFLFAEPGLGV